MSLNNGTCKEYKKPNRKYCDTLENEKDLGY